MKEKEQARAVDLELTSRRRCGRCGRYARARDLAYLGTGNIGIIQNIPVFEHIGGCWFEIKQGRLSGTEAAP